MLFQKANLIAVIISKNFKHLTRGDLLAPKCGILLKYPMAGITSAMVNMSTDMGSSKNLIAVGQMKATNDKEHNMKQVEELVRRAKEKEVEFLFLPENCDFVGEHRKQTLELAEPLNGNTVKKLQALAKENCMWLSLGSVHESILDENNSKSDKIYNSHVLLNSSGEIVQIYRKLHLFDVDTPDFKFKESQVVSKGPQLVPPIETPIGKIGLLICYDVRFPEVSTLLRKNGAQIVTYPAAFAYSTGKAHWEILLRARAIENQCYVIAAAQLGWHNKKRQSWGHAMIVDPWGRILADCGSEDELCIATAEISLDPIEGLKKSMPCFDHRRNDIYSLTACNQGSVCPEQDRNFATNIIKKDTIFYESEHCYAFTNLRCVVKGHVLVSTKRVTPRLSGLDCAEITDLFNTVCMVQRMLERFYDTTSATVTVQDGSLAGQTVPHVHFHVMPRRDGDFPHNDQIYVKLDDSSEDKPCRTIEERMEEAKMYRCFIAENK